MESMRRSPGGELSDIEDTAGASRPGGTMQTYGRVRSSAGRMPLTSGRDLAGLTEREREVRAGRQEAEKVHRAHRRRSAC
jgi:hypothetical protein